MEKEQKITMKQVFVKNRKLRVIGLITVCTWFCFAVQFFGKYISYGKDGKDFLQVFSLINSGNQCEETLSGNGFFIGEEKEIETLLKMLEKDCGITIKKEGKREYSIEENGNLVGTIKVQPLKKNFLLHLEMKKKGKESNLYLYKLQIDERMKKEGIKQWKSYYDVSFLADSSLTKKQQKKIAKKMSEMLEAKQTLSFDLDGLLCWYGKSRKIREGVHTNGVDVNVQITFSKEEDKQRTRCYIGTPILNGEY